MGSVEEADDQRRMGWEAWTHWDGGDAGICVGGSGPAPRASAVNRVAVQERRGHPGPGFAWEKETRVSMGALGLWPLEAAPTHLNRK